MFQKIRRSLGDHKTSHAADNVLDCEQHICHACGQHISQPFENGDEFLARPYELYEPSNRDSWNSAGFSDSGYGSLSGSQKAESLLQLGGPCTQSTTFVRPSSRRSTYTTSIYSNEDDLECVSSLQDTAEPVHMQTPGYQHSFELPPRSSTKTSRSWKPKSRYARLNELPAASPGTPLVDCEMDIREDEAKSGKKKRVIQCLETLLPRPSSFQRRLIFSRMQYESRKR